MQGFLVFVLEEVLYSGDHPDMVSAAYPAFLVVRRPPCPPPPPRQPSPVWGGGGACTLTDSC